VSDQIAEMVRLPQFASGGLASIERRNAADVFRRFRARA
jgi:hypothetical protein